MQWPWQRGDKPNPGGSAHSDDLPGNAPGNWGETEGRYGYNVVVDIAANVRTEKLTRYEIESKLPPRPLANSPVVAGTRAYAAHERAENAKAQ